MIIEDNNLFRIDKPEWVRHLTEEQRGFLIKAEESSILKFIIPQGLTANQEKQIYKIGFLSEFLSLLYPDKNFKFICEILSDRYDVFLSRRQIDRNVKKYKEDEKFH